MIIDDTTGLPVVPDGYFWRVRQTDNGHPYSAMHVDLCRKETVEVPAKTEESKVSDGNLWNLWTPTYETTVIAEATTVQETVVVFSRELVEVTETVIGKPPEGRGWHMRAFQLGVREGHRRYHRALPATPESVLRIAQEIWKDREDKMAELRRIESIVGEYPPNKLEVS